MSDTGPVLVRTTSTAYGANESTADAQPPDFYFYVAGGTHSMRSVGRVWPAVRGAGAPLAEAVQTTTVSVIPSTFRQSSGDGRQEKAGACSEEEQAVEVQIEGRVEVDNAAGGGELEQDEQWRGGGEERGMARARRFCRRHRWRLFSLGAVLLVILLLAVFHEQVGWLWEVYSSWLEDHKVKGAFSFIIVTAFLTIICFPAAVPTLAAGAIYGMCNGLTAGVAIGSAIIFTGATLGSLVAFLLGRYAFHGWLEHINRRSRWASALNRALQTNGLK